MGVGYAAADYQAAVFLNDAQVVTGMYAHGVTATATVGAEVAHNLSSKVTTFSAGVAKKLEAGTSVKARLDNNGLVSVLYEQVSGAVHGGSAGSVECGLPVRQGQASGPTKRDMLGGIRCPSLPLSTCHSC